MRVCKEVVDHILASFLPKMKVKKRLIMTPSITALALYDLVQCPKRVELSLLGDPANRNEVGAFVAMRRQRGTQ